MGSAVKLNLFMVRKVHHRLMHQNVGYLLGAKAKLDSSLDSIKNIDCSGLIRLLVYHATNKKLIIPDGSFNQRDWLLSESKKENNVIHRELNYENIKYNPDSLYLCTLNPIGKKAGHIWFVYNGFTMESHGGKGPDERVWNTPILKSEVDYVFRWEHFWKGIN